MRNRPDTQTELTAPAAIRVQPPGGLRACAVMLAAIFGLPLCAAGQSLTPFLGSPAAVPGTIQAANFDNGGEGVAYHDNSPGNTGGLYRGTDVDIAASSEGGYTIGWIGVGDWVNSRRCPYNDAWTWNGISWTQQYPTNVPLGRFAAGMVYDPTGMGELIFGGFGCGYTLGDTKVLRIVP